MTLDQQAPIGIFDSGIGGLTVVSAIRKHLPNESLVYLGDTARVPYGTKSAETVVRYANECADFLLGRGVKAIVVACNTASAYALDDLTRRLNVPVLGVIEPGARAALAASSNKVVGVVGTQGTVQSNAYGKALKSIDENVRVVSRACPLFVPLVEEGWVDNEVAAAAVKRYLNGIGDEGVDALVLGCTHYPLLANTIREQLGPGITLVDSAETTAGELMRLLEARECKSNGDRESSCRFYVTDLPARFETIARRFLGEDLPAVTRVDL